MAARAASRMSAGSKRSRGSSYGSRGSDLSSGDDTHTEETHSEGDVPAALTERAVEIMDVIKSTRSAMRRQQKNRSDANKKLRKAKEEISVVKANLRSMADVLEELEERVNTALTSIDGHKRKRFLEFMSSLVDTATATDGIMTATKKEQALKHEMDEAKAELAEDTRLATIAMHRAKIEELEKAAAPPIPAKMVTIAGHPDGSKFDNKESAKFHKLETMTSVTVSAATGDVILGGAGLPPPRILDHKERAVVFKAKQEAIKRASRISDDVMRADWVTSYARDFVDETTFAFKVDKPTPSRAVELAELGLDEDETTPSGELHPSHGVPVYEARKRAAGGAGAAAPGRT